MTGDAPRQPWWKQIKGGVAEGFRWHDGLTLLLGAILGLAGSVLFSGDISTTSSLLVLAILTFCAAVGISRYRAETEAKAIAILEGFRGDAIDELRGTHEELQKKLKKHLNRVHASVSFVPDASGVSGAPASGKPGYDVGTATVRRAQKRIFVMGDYGPPPGEGAALDEPPEHRSDYLRAIEEMLIGRLEPGLDSAGPLDYIRFIQRPTGVYNRVKKREDAGRPGITLTSDDMIGDEQVFEHCKRVLEIVSRAERQGGDRIRVQIKVIPFLPNCPSVLLVDDRDVQFTIPTRIDRPGDNYARQGLLGVLVMEDNAGGSEICDSFEELFSRLIQFSAAVIKIENDDLTAVDPLPDD